MITHTGKIFDTPTADKHHRMFLQIMPDTRNIRSNFYPTIQPHTGNFP